MPDGNVRTPVPALILLSGVPGAGKTTFAHALATVFPFVHIESDAIRRTLSPRPSYTPRESAAVFRRAREQASRALQAGQHVLIDATNLSPRDRRPFIHLAHTADARLIAVRLTAPEATIRERLSHPREGNSQATVEVYELMQHRARPLSRPAIVVDTRFPLGPSIDLVRRLVHDEGE